MSMFIASANTNTMSNPVKVITARDIAEKLGLSISAVSGAIKMNAVSKNLSAKTIKRIQETAKEMGYDPELAKHVRRPVVKREKFYYGGNFHTKEEEVARMLALREEGFNNREIAQKIGRSVQMVYRYIGTQPNDMSRAKFLEGQRIRYEKVARRKAYVESHKVTVHNDTVRKVNELTEKMNASMAEIRELRKVHDEMVAAIATTESDIRKIAEKMGLEVMEIQPVVYSVPETNTAVQTSFLN